MTLNRYPRDYGGRWLQWLQWAMETWFLERMQEWWLVQFVLFQVSWQLPFLFLSSSPISQCFIAILKQERSYLDREGESVLLRWILWLPYRLLLPILIIISQVLNLRIIITIAVPKRKQGLHQSRKLAFQVRVVNNNLLHLEHQRQTTAVAGVTAMEVGLLVQEKAFQKTKEDNNQFPLQVSKSSLSNRPLDLSLNRKKRSLEEEESIIYDHRSHMQFQIIIESRENLFWITQIIRTIPAPIVQKLPNL